MESSYLRTSYDKPQNQHETKSEGVLPSFPDVFRRRFSEKASSGLIITDTVQRRECYVNQGMEAQNTN